MWRATALLKVHAAGFDFRQVKNIVDQFQQMTTAIMNDLQPFFALCLTGVRRDVAIRQSQ